MRTGARAGHAGPAAATPTRVPPREAEPAGLLSTPTPRISAQPKPPLTADSGAVWRRRRDGEQRVNGHAEDSNCRRVRGEAMRATPACRAGRIVSLPPPARGPSEPKRRSHAEDVTFVARRSGGRAEPDRQLRERDRRLTLIGCRSRCRRYAARAAGRSGGGTRRADRPPASTDNGNPHAGASADRRCTSTNSATPAPRRTSTTWGYAQDVARQLG
jgi:hypothetical protein